MPHDFFMLFYRCSSFSQVDPAIGKVDRDHPAFGPKFANIIREANRLLKKWAKLLLNECEDALKAQGDDVQRGAGGTGGQERRGSEGRGRGEGA